MEKKQRLRIPSKAVFWVALGLLCVMFTIVVPYNYFTKKNQQTNPYNLYHTNSANFLGFESNSEIDQYFEDIGDGTQDGLTPQTAYVFEGMSFWTLTKYDVYAHSYSYHPIIALYFSNINRYTIIRNCSFNGIYMPIRIVECENFAVENSSFRNGPYGIYLRLSSNCRVFGNIGTDCMYGLEFNNCSNLEVFQNDLYDLNNAISITSGSTQCNVFNNTISHCRGIGMWLTSSNNNSLYNNTLIDSIFIKNGADVSQFDSSNLIDGKSLTIIYNQSNVILNNLKLTQIFLEDCINFTFSNCTMGFTLINNATNLNINNCSFSNISTDYYYTQFFPVTLNFANNFTLQDTNFTQCGLGVLSYNSNNTHINKCHFTDISTYAIRLYRNNENKVENNQFLRVKSSFYIYYCENTSINSNDFQNSKITESVSILNTLESFENNTAYSLPIGIWLNQIGISITEHYGYYLFYNCSQFSIEDQVIEETIADFQYCSEFTITNFSLSNSFWGIKFYSCYDFEIESMELNNISETAITCDYCYDFSIYRLICVNNLDSGLILKGCTRFSIENSEFKNNDYGIVSLSNEVGEYCSINFIGNTIVGILSISEESILIRDSIIHNGEYGILIVNTDDSWIVNNTISKTSNIAMRLLTCDDLLIANNLFEMNNWDISQENTIRPSNVISPNPEINQQIILFNTSISMRYLSYSYTMVIFYKDTGLHYSISGSYGIHEYKAEISYSGVAFYDYIIEKGITIGPGESA